ncbi:MAG: sel1 repeat family protein, partial [Proteobacteria bacterium]|nr:sel1 repeat family protein [Pseudomonadota bacterium]
TSAGTRTFRFDPVAESIIRSFPGGLDLIPTYDSSMFKGALINDDHELSNHLALAQAGNSESQSMMGFAAQYAGNGQLAKSWFVKAAAQGNAAASFALGNIEFESNYERAYQSYMQAADGGVVPAKRNLGYFLLRGIGVDQDRERGKVLLGQASKAGDAVATDLLK